MKYLLRNNLFAQKWTVIGANVFRTNALLTSAKNGEKRELTQ